LNSELNVPVRIQIPLCAEYSNVTGNKTKPNVFIIESLSFDNEQNNRYEGKFLSQILHLGLKEAAYFYVQTKGELTKAISALSLTIFNY
jgi:hypothetical protein